MSLSPQPLSPLPLEKESLKFSSDAVHCFIDTLNTIVPLSASLIEALQQIITIQKLPKGTVLQVEGQVSDRVFFIVEGLARSFYFEDGQELTSRIVAENDFISSPYSYITLKPSFETIHLLESSTIICIHKSDIEKLHEKFPQAITLSLKITERYLILYDNRIRALRLSAEEKLLYFKTQYPHLVMRVQIAHLATYLGISRSCLSHLRTKR